MEERERKRTGIASLKIRLQPGFRLLHRNFQRQSRSARPRTTSASRLWSNAERFTSPELKEYERKVLDADERILEIERRLYAELRE